MHLRCRQRDLARAVTAASRILPPRSSLSRPVLLLEAQESLTVRAAAADIQVRLKVNAEVEAAGRTAVAAHTFTDLITLLDDRDLTLDDGDGQLRVQGFQVDSAFQVLDANSVPAEFQVEQGRVASVSAPELFAACSRVEIALAAEDTVPILTGALARFTSQQLVLVGTDGRRLAVDKVALREPEGAFAELVLPAKLISEIRRLFESEVGDVRCVVEGSGRRISIETSNVSVRALGLEGTYPNYETRLPKRVKTNCVVQTDLLTRRLQAAAMFAPDEIRSVQLQLSPGSGLVLSASAPDRGATVAELATDVIGPASTLGINPIFLLDGLRVVVAEQVELQVAEEPDVLVLRAVPSDDFLYLVVPFIRRPD